MYGESGMRRLSDFAHCGRTQAALGASQLTRRPSPNQTHRLPGLNQKKKVQYLVVHAPRNDAYPMTRHVVRRDLEVLIPVHPHRDAPSLQWEDAAEGNHSPKKTIGFSLISDSFRCVGVKSNNTGNVLVQETF